MRAQDLHLPFRLGVHHADMPARIAPGELALTAALLAVYYSSRTSAKVLGVMHGALQR
jgi:hypothetical protein